MDSNINWQLSEKRKQLLEFGKLLGSTASIEDKDMFRRQYRDI